SRSPRRRKWKPVSASIVIGMSSGKPAIGSVSRSWRQSGRIGSSTPSCPPTSADQGPAAITKTSASSFVASSPSRTSTPPAAARPPSPSPSRRLQLDLDRRASRPRRQAPPAGRRRSPPPRPRRLQRSEPLVERLTLVFGQLAQRRAHVFPDRHPAPLQHVLGRSMERELLQAVANRREVRAGNASHGRGHLTGEGRRQAGDNPHRS